MANFQMQGSVPCSFQHTCSGSHKKVLVVPLRKGVVPSLPCQRVITGDFHGFHGLGQHQGLKVHIHGS